MASFGMSIDTLAARMRQGDARAIGRALTHIEQGGVEGERLLAHLYPLTGHAYIVGITGPPGAGKSSLVDGLVQLLRARALTVGVLAVDPSSPFSGGAILGDRIRMQSHSGDEGVFIRSMSARGRLGGLSSATRGAVHVLDAAGKDIIIIETVGVGQSEVAIAATSDTTVVVLTPTAGDMVQMLKAGVTEVADLFAVNKADVEGAGRVVGALRNAQGLGEHGHWVPPIVTTQATIGAGLNDLWRAIEEHRIYLNTSGALGPRRRERLRGEIVELVLSSLRARIRADLADAGALSELLDAVERREQDPYSAARAILEQE